MKTTIDKFKAARRVSAPLVAITGPDNAATIAGIMGSYGDAQPPCVQWDCVQGYRGLNKSGMEAMVRVSSDDDTSHPIAALIAAKKLPGMNEGGKGCIVFALNLHLFATEPTVIQAIWNLRDEFKQDRRTLVMLTPAIKLPPELANDVLVIDEAYPTDKQIEEIVTRTHKDAGQILPDIGTMAKAVAATAGLPAFPAEQVIAMSLTPKGIDIASLWERKKQSVEQTPGLKVWQGEESFEKIGGLKNVKGFLTKMVKGKNAPRVVVFIDEIEKQLAGAGGDTSGTSQDQMGSILSFMQNEKAQGILLFGPAGTGKSNLAKATGNEAGVPTIELDFGGMKHEHVGGSEARIRAALKVIKAIGQDRMLFIATCNSMTSLPPELRRRFKSGTFFMDLPNKEERAELWNMFMNRSMIPKKSGSLPNDTDWTGAEIEQCCEYAESFGVTLKEAAQYIVPVAVSASEIVQGLRRNASGKFISASYAGMYEYKESTTKPGVPNGNRMISDE